MNFFEYDETKSLSNEQKHGINFIQAQTLWEDDDLLEFPASKVDDEIRYFAIGRIKGKYWTAVITYRSEKIRIISVRCSRKEEVKVYESQGI